MGLDFSRNFQTALRVKKTRELKRSKVRESKISVRKEPNAKGSVF